MKTASVADRPFTTSNAILAFSLYLAGVPFIDDSKPLLNVYDNEILKNLGFAGLTLEEGTRAALQAGKKGHVTFSFRWTPELGNLLKAFGEMEKKITDSSETVAKAAEELMLEEAKIGHVDEALVKIACLILKSRGQFMNQWKGREDLAMIRVPNPGKAEIRDGPHGSKIVSNPGYRLVSLNASEKTKRSLHL
jgi:hypothetical protein